MHGRGMLIMALGLVLGLFLVMIWEQLAGPPQGPPEDLPALEVPLPAGCEPSHSVCTLVSGELQIGLQLAGPVRPLTPFQVELFTAGAGIREVSVEFTMPGMDMGLQRYRLLREAGRWRGVVTLPVCTTGRVDWRMLVELRGTERRWRVAVPVTMGSAE